ncbi:MAG: hypothetical protein ACRC10_13040 [Thermoguttaceae bacterium]
MNIKTECGIWASDPYSCYTVACHSAAFRVKTAPTHNTQKALSMTDPTQQTVRNGLFSDWNAGILPAFFL